jgi:hypothetical protein
MHDPDELDKQRDIVFDPGFPDQAGRAFLLLSGLPNCKVERGDSPNVLRVCYNLRHYTLEGLEDGLLEEGFRLDQGPLHSIARKVIYYCEDTICHNLDIPAQPTKKNEREVFVKAYEHTPHGDRDETPPELRDYR